MVSAAQQLDGATLSPADFKLLTDFVYREAGLVYTQDKTSLVRSRLVKRLKISGAETFKDYYGLITSPSGAKEKEAFISALTTNVSHFFREAHHFEYLKTKILPDVMAHAKMGGAVRIWSAGCSNGQEPYSIGMCLLEFDRDALKHDIKILATDIDPNVVAYAKAATYEQSQIGGVSDKQTRQFLTPVTDGITTRYQVTEDVRSFVTFRQLNLLQDWPMKGQFQFVFCRNVLIYFDDKTQDTLWPRFAAGLAPGGTLFLGHSERVSQPETHRLKQSGVTCYTKD
jgi:chemotaxis protein methyltransferase CheR